MPGSSPADLGWLHGGRHSDRPFTPGYIGDTNTIGQLAELGVIFLMFGVGIHFSIGDLWKVRNIAIPGAIGQMLITTILGYLLAQ